MALKVKICLWLAIGSFLGASPAFSVAQGKYSGITQEGYPFWIHVNAASKIDSFYLKHFLWTSYGSALGVVPSKYSFATGTEIPIAGGTFLYRAISDSDTVQISGAFLDSSVTGFFEARQKATSQHGEQWAHTKWQATSSARKYLVRYDGNGATAGSVPTDAAYPPGTTLAVSANAGGLNKLPATFVSWTLTPEGLTRGYYLGDSITMGFEDIVFYAYWRAISYPVRYESNGSTSGSAPSTANHLPGATVSVAGRGSLFRRSFAFEGWSSSADGSGTSYDSGSTFKMGSAAVVLFARWRQFEGRTVSYDGNGATNGGPPVDSGLYPSGDSVVVLAPTWMSKRYHNFTGWTLAADGSGASYWPGAKLRIGDADVKLFAQWKKEISRLVLRSGGHGKVKSDLGVADTLRVPAIDTSAIEAVADSGFEFDHWTHWNCQPFIEDSTDASTRIAALDSVAVVTAVFRPQGTLGVQGPTRAWEVGFSPSHRSLRLHIPATGGRNVHVSIELLDLSGRIIGTLLDRPMPPGTHDLWVGSFPTGGVSICRLRSSGIERNILIRPVR